MDHAAQGIVHFEQFVDAGAAAIAGVVAFGAADGALDHVRFAEAGEQGQLRFIR